MDKEIQYRALTPEDIDQVRYYSNDRTLTNYMFTGIFPNRPFEIKPEDVVFGVALNTILGIVGLFNINWQARHAELRIFLWKNQNNGIGTEACKFIVDYAFNMLNLNKVWLGTNLSNAPAVKCYQSAGFDYVGTLKDEIFRNGQYYDVWRMECYRQG